MIPILYESTETEFVSEGLGRLSDALSCNVVEERNGSYELEMTYPVTGVHYADIQLKRVISAVPADGKTRQPFVIYKISRPLNGKVTINARHISYMLSGVITAPGSASTCAEALAVLKANALTDCPFTFWTDKDTAASYSCDVPASIRSRLGGVEGSILDCYGGEYEWDNFTVKLHAHRGNDNGVRIAYGKNLTDIKQEESIESTVVGIYPYWKKDASDGEEAQLVTLSGPVYADNADNYPYKLVSVLDCSQEWQSAPTTAQLLSYTQAYIKNNSIGIPSVSIDISFVALWQTEEYKNIAPLERVNLCDTVHVDFEQLGVSATAKVIKTDYDVLAERYNSITIGDARSSLGSTISDIAEDSAVKAARDNTSFFQTAIANATKLIQGGLGGHIVINTNANGEPNEILIMDTADKTTAVNVIRMNVNGIGFSTSGYNGPFTTAWTIDGAFNADFITTGAINANLLTVGTITDQNHANYWNLTTGDFRLSPTAIKVNGLAKSEDTMATVTVEYAQNGSATQAPTDGWSTVSPSWTDGKYVWSRTKSVSGTGVITYSDPTCITGATGKTGKGVQSSAVTYQLGTSATDAPTGSWSTNPSYSKGQYLWTRTVITYTDNTISTIYSVSYCAKDGSNGSDGKPGKDGTSITNTDITYAAHTSGTTYPTSGWSTSIPTVPAGSYLWTRMIWTYSDGTTETGYSVSKTGIGVKQTIPEYYLSTSKTEPTGGTWSTTQPDWQRYHCYWTRSKITWTDGTITYTDPVLATGINAANESVEALDDELDQEEIFNRLTNNGETQGVYMQDGKLYINADYIKSGKLSASLIEGGILKVGGKNNGYGKIEIYAYTDDVLGSITSDGFTLKTSDSGISYVQNSSYSAFEGNESELRDEDLTIRALEDNGAYASIGVNHGTDINTSHPSETNSYLTVNSGSLDDNFMKANKVFIGARKGTTQDDAYISMTSLVSSSSGSGYSYKTVHLSPLKFTCSGTKSREVNTDQYGNRLLYCYETPSPMFGDIGEGTIGDDGLCYVPIESVFAQTISDTANYQVFLQNYGDGDSYVKSRSPSFFVVAGTPGLKFGWELKAKQAGYDQIRMQINEMTNPESVVTKSNAAEAAVVHLKNIQEGRITNEVSNSSNSVE